MTIQQHIATLPGAAAALDPDAGHGAVEPGVSLRDTVRRGARSYVAEARRGIAALEEIAGQWAELRANTLVRNWGYEERFALPALRRLGKEAAEPSALLVWNREHDRSGAPQRDELAGLFLFRSGPAPATLLAPLTRSWEHHYAYDGTPLLHKDHAEPALEAMLDWFGSRGGLGGFTLLRNVPGDGVFQSLVANIAQRTARPWRPIGAYARAMLTVPANAQAYVRENLVRRRRKEFQRLRRRLEEQGEVASVSFQPGDDRTAWLRTFYALEAQGWKGRAGTALACKQGRTAFFDEALETYAEAGDLLFWKLTLKGAPLAMCFGMKSGRQAWLLKTAYDEAHERFSPGALIIFDVIESLSARGDIGWIDSCAAPDHPMIDHIWKERLAVADVLIGPRACSPALFDLVCGLEQARKAGRAHLKDFYNTYLKGKRP